MEIRLRSNGQTMYEAEFRAYQLANGGPTWGETTTEVLESLGADVVFEGPQATSPDRYHYSQRQGVEQIDGKWYTKYVLGPIFTDNEEGTAAEQETAYRARIDEEVKTSNKETAARLLSESDFYDLPNTSSKIENIDDILAYRDALRAIALNPTKDAEFPTKPATIWK